MRRQVYDLTPDDLQKYPAWEFALDEEGAAGQDEATVRPILSSGPVDGTSRLAVVATKFVLAGGLTMAGYLYVPSETSDALADVQPVIVTAFGQVRFWFGVVVPTLDDLSQAYKLLGHDASYVFPISFKTTVPVKGGAIRGAIQGFQHFKTFPFPPTGPELVTCR